MRLFIGSQLSAALATVVDFSVMALGVEVFGIWYVAAVALGAASGALTNFLVNRSSYIFGRGSHGISVQARRYIVVSAGSLALNTVGVYALTEALGLHYVASKVIVAVAVGVFYNFRLHRNYVFR